MKKSSKARVLFWSLTSLVFLVAGLLATQPATVSAQAKGKEKNLFPANTEVVIGKAALPDPLRPYDSMIDPKFIEISPLKETSGCTQLEVWQPVVVEPEQWVAIIGVVPMGTSEVGILAVNPNVNCVRPGHPMRVVHIRSESGISVEEGWFFPTSIHGRRTENQEVIDLENQLLLTAKMPLDAKDVVFVTGRVISSLRKPWAPRMSGTRFIDRKQMEAAIKDGTTIVDIRSRASFEKFRIKGSINVPYTTGPRMQFHEDYKDYSKSGDAFDVRKVPADKEKPVIITGAFDIPALYRAAVVLRGEGWKNIFIFWEGIEDFTGMIWSPPVTSELIRVVAAHEVAKMMADKTLNPVIVDVRRPVQFSVAHIPGAYPLEFYERLDIRLRLPGLNGEMLLDYGEYATVPEGLSTATPIIFVGSDESHWAPYKAALIARSYGFANVMWYRGGMAEWGRLRLANSRLFRVNRAPFPLPKDFKGGVGR